MSVEVVPGGQRRIDRVLDPGFTDGVDRLGLPELRARREEAEAEEADVSYLRRLLQGRRHPQGRAGAPLGRGGDQDVGGLLAGLPAILTDDAPAPSAPSRASRCRRGPPSTGAGSSGWSRTRPSPACPSWTSRS